MKTDRRKLYREGRDFFDLDGNAVMKLSREAAIAVCREAASRGLLVLKIEGGIWSGRTFEARLDAIWDGADPPIAETEARENNRAAANFIRSRDPGYNAFVVTSSSLSEHPDSVADALATNREGLE